MRKPVSSICEQQRCRLACASAQSVQLSTFVVHYLDSVIPILAKSKISRLYLVSVAEQAGLSLICYLVGNPRRQVFSWCGSIVLKTSLKAVTVIDLSDVLTSNPLVSHCCIHTGSTPLGLHVRKPYICITNKVFRNFHPFWIFPSCTRGCKTTSCMTSGRRFWHFDVILRQTFWC